MNKSGVVIAVVVAGGLILLLNKKSEAAPLEPPEIPSGREPITIVWQ